MEPKFPFAWSRAHACHDLIHSQPCLTARSVVPWNWSSQPYIKYTHDSMSECVVFHAGCHAFVVLGQWRLISKTRAYPRRETKRNVDASPAPLQIEPRPCAMLSCPPPLLWWHPKLPERLVSHVCLAGGVLDPCPDLGRKLKYLVQVSLFIACPWPYQGYHAPHSLCPACECVRDKAEILWTQAYHAWFDERFHA